MLGDRIEKFSGTGERTFEEFLDDYTDLIARFGIPHSVARTLLPLYLVGGAKLKYQTIANHDTLPWNELVTELAKKLKSEALLSNLRDELHNMTQGKDSVREFAKKVYNKTKIAFQGQGEGIVSRMATDFFIKGLNPEIRKAIRRLPDTNEFDIVVCNAEKTFRILEQERKENRDAIQAITALITDEKVNQLEKQLNQMKLAQRRPTSSIVPRPRNRFQTNGRTQQGSFNSPNMFFPNSFRRGNNSFRPRRGFLSRFQRNPRARFGQQYFQSWYPTYPTYASSPNIPSTSNSNNGQPQIQPGPSSRMAITEPIDCTSSYDAPMIRTTVHLYAEQSNQLLLNATKCYRDVMEIAVTNFLYIRTARTILNRRRVSIPHQLCKTAHVTGKIQGHELVQISPGLRTTNEIEEENNTLPLWGTNKQLRSIYTIENGEISSPDGRTIISSLGNLENCKLSEGFCLSKDQTVIWEPIHTAPVCRYSLIGSYEALVTMRHIILPHADLVFQFSSDYLLHEQLTEYCEILFNSYLTTSNHILIFPHISRDIMIHDYILRMSRPRRVRRNVRYLTDKHGRSSCFQLVTSESIPLITQLFDTDITNQIPNFRTRPIVKRKILQEIQRWNVTNEDFNKKRRFYNITDPRFIPLRTIRYAQYLKKQLQLFDIFEEDRPLNYALFLRYHLSGTGECTRKLTSSFSQDAVLIIGSMLFLSLR
ncbi:hypothetical protein Y032_0002g1065 [Ancylostoma ceylanicum]|uniref:Uncharacterized protein n=1 Tax=Ancylostoma ceylanicum TaxID=53326 RepID=A0A016W0C0_9BILA|nr:hypothetical protein Y032_0002g1065 [Ancylostoma ceylanicum]